MLVTRHVRIANREDPDQTASSEAVWSGFVLFFLEHLPQFEMHFDFFWTSTSSSNTISILYRQKLLTLLRVWPVWLDFLKDPRIAYTKSAFNSINQIFLDILSLNINPGPEVIKLFSCSTQLSTKFKLLLKTKTLTIYFKSLALSLSDVVFIMLINVKMPTIVGILTFISRISKNKS